MRNGLNALVSIVFVLFGIGFVPVTNAAQLAVKLTAEKAAVSVLHDGEMVHITRNQNAENLVDPMWAKTSRQCPPFCIEPKTPVPGVELFTELELFEFMETKVNAGQGVIIDARLPDWYLRGTIPGSINIPFTVFQRDPADPKLKTAFELLGVRPRGPVNTFTRLTDQVFGNGEKTDTWDFSGARELVLWCNGPWCGQSPHAIRALVKQGYPVNKIHYYRGGMQNWQILGLTTVMPSERSVLFPQAGSE
jgi:rhodanese-related sulfurtransferase